MSLEFKKYFVLALVFNKDINKIILRKVNGKLDAFFMEVDQTGKAPMVDLTSHINKETSCVIDPAEWRNVVTLLQIEKIASTMVVSVRYDKDIQLNDNIELHDVDNLPNNILPSLRWIIPLCLDVCIIGSSYNQVIIR